jgi:hypothetical protein
LRVGPIVGAIAGLVFGLVYSMKEGAITGLVVGLVGGPLAGSLLGLLGGLISGLVSGWLGGFTDTVKLGKVSPNQGINLSRKNSLVVFVATSLALGLVGGLIGLLLRPQTKEVLYLALIDGLIVGLFVGIFFGLIVGLHRGGSAVIKHYALRLILWMNRCTPLNFVKFLDQCATLILLKKVGGGYIFIHRMLLEYFAELTPESVKAGDTTTGPK